MQQGRWSLPRQPGALPGGAAAPAVSGVSSFAFQGTNAHVLLAASPAGSGINHPAAGLWKRSSYWVLAPQFDLVQAVQAGSQLALFAASLQQPAAAALLQVVAGGSRLVTVGAVVELAAEAAAAQLAAGTVASADGSSRLLHGITVGNAAVIASSSSSSSSGSRKHAAVVLQVAVAPRAGSFEVLLQQGGSRSSTGTACGSGRIGTIATVSAPGATTSQARLPSVLSALQASRQPPATPTAVAALASEPHSLLQSVAVGPAVVDASLQLASHGQLAAAVDAALVGGSAAAADHKHAAAGSSGVILAYGSGSAALHLVGISHSSAARAPSSASLPAAAAVEQPEAWMQQPAGLLYGIAWEAAAVAPAGAAAQVSDAGLAFRAGRGAGAAEAIALAQTALKQGASSIAAHLSAGLLPTAAPSAEVAASTAAAEVHGMLKALSQEAPALSLAVSSNSGPSSMAAPWTLAVVGKAAPSASSSSGSSDVHGLASSGGASFLPRLLPQQSSSGRADSLAAGNVRGSFLVTGGSGVLGGYTALWLLHQGAESVVLLSRSGGMPEAVQQAGGITDASIVSSKADAALAADVAAMLADSSTGIRGIMHAGGVLADATLANQTLAGIRKVSLPANTRCHLAGSCLVLIVKAGSFLLSSMPQSFRSFMSAGAGSQAVGACKPAAARRSAAA